MYPSNPFVVKGRGIRKILDDSASGVSCDSRSRIGTGITSVIFISKCNSILWRLYAAFLLIADKHATMFPYPSTNHE